MPQLHRQGGERARNFRAKSFFSSQQRNHQQPWWLLCCWNVELQLPFGRHLLLEEQQIGTTQCLHKNPGLESQTIKKLQLSARQWLLILLTPSNSNSMYYYTGSFLGPGHLLKTELDIKTKELKDLNVSWRHLQPFNKFFLITLNIL